MESDTLAIVLFVAEYFRKDLGLSDTTLETMLCALCTPEQPAAALLLHARVGEVNCHRIAEANRLLPFRLAEDQYKSVSVHNYDDLSGTSHRLLRQAQLKAHKYGHDVASTEHLLSVVLDECEGSFETWAARLAEGDPSVAIDGFVEVRELTEELLSHESYPHFYRGEQLQEDMEIWQPKEGGKMGAPLPVLKEILFWKIMNS